MFRHVHDPAQKCKLVSVLALTGWILQYPNRPLFGSATFIHIMETAHFFSELLFVRVQENNTLLEETGKTVGVDELVENITELE